MNTDTELKRAAEQNHARFPKLIINSTSAILGMALLAVGLLVPCGNAATTVASADQDFILATAQGA
jgi:hypothetical protein